MFDYQRMFHTGFIVHDLKLEMARYSEGLGLRWATPYVYEALNIWTPDRGEHQIRLEAVYSIEGPQHLELLVGPPGSPYDPAAHTGHHVGFWVSDVRATVEPLLSQGWSVVLSGASPERGFGGFTYLRPPGAGMMVEVVSEAARPRLENWWAGASGPIL